jgi:hypothetical protein
VHALLAFGFGQAEQRREELMFSLIDSSGYRLPPRPCGMKAMRA